MVCLLVEANGPIGPATGSSPSSCRRVDTPKILVVSKADLAPKADDRPSSSRWSPASWGSSTRTCRCPARTGDGVDALVGELERRLPEGPQYYPDGVGHRPTRDFLVAELVREKLLRVARDELPHSIAVVAEEIERAASRDDGRSCGSAVRVLVERDSQKGIVIGKGGAVIKEAGSSPARSSRRCSARRVYLETQVKVERGLAAARPLARPPGVLALRRCSDLSQIGRGRCLHVVTST